MSKWSFPNPVDEVSARTTAAGVVLLATVALITGSKVVSGLIAAGFLLRVMSGPNLSPLALAATRLVRPRIPAAPRWTPGPPKRFAQGMGLAFATAATLLLAAGNTEAGRLVLAGLIAAALLESVLGFCAGCRIFAGLMRVGLVPREVCERCANLNLSAPSAD